MPSAMPTSSAPAKVPEEPSTIVTEESSRIFVKNLPPNITEESLRNHFSTGGRHITDVKLITRRRIAFLGYRSPEEAKTAVRYFNRSYIRMSKLFVEVAKPIGDLSLPGGSNLKRPHEVQETAAEDPQNTAQDGQLSKKRKLDEASDPKLREFLQVMKPQTGRGLSSTADVFAAMGDSQMAQPDSDATADAAAAAALAAAEGESDDEYDALPAKQSQKAKAVIDDETTATEKEGVEKDATKVVISATAIDEVVRNAADSPSLRSPAPPQQESQQQKQQQQQQQQQLANASASDDEWLRSRTNRLLDLLDPSELEPPTSTPLPAQVVAKAQTGLREAAKEDEGCDEIDEGVSNQEDSSIPTDNKVAKVVEAAAPLSREPLSPEDQIRETSRLFIRNLPYDATEAHIWKYFETFGNVEEVNLPVTNSGSNKGFAMVLFATPSSALAAFHNADGKTFQGRILHVLPAKAKKSATDIAMDEFAISQMPLKKQKLLRKKAEAATSTFSWNALFMSQDAVNAAVAERLGVTKSEMLDPTSSGEAVRQAVRQTSIIEETKGYFAANGVDLDSFKPHTKRGDRSILVKNFAYGTSAQELRSMFEEFGPVVRVLMPTGGTIAIVQFAQAAHGRLAYSRLAYRRVNDTLLMLEKCPETLFGDSTNDEILAGAEDQKEKSKRPKVTASELLGEHHVAEEEADAAADTEATTSSLFVRNLNFTTTTEQLRAAFAELPGFVSARVNTKPNPKKPGETLSMGYGFVEFRTKATSEAASKTMNGFILHSHTLTVQTAHRGQQDAAADRREADRKKKQAANGGSKLIIKNLPFEATRKDVYTLLGTYGQVKAVRLPRKVGNGTRGYAFAEFLTPTEAASAMSALRDTHLLGRRLVIQYAEAEALDPEEELAKMRKKVGSQMNTVALQQLTGGRRQRTKVHIGEEGGEEGM